MKSSEITIGNTYSAKVSDKVVPVRIDRENARGGWDATNLVTNKTVRIKSAQRLRGPVERGTKKAKPAGETPKPEVNPTVEVITGQPVPAPVKREKKPKAEKPAKEPKPMKAPRSSGLTAAYQVLLDAGEPMACKAMVEKVLAAGTWKTGGKTPEATIYAAIIREIRAKGSESRFRKTDRGLFAANAK
jgi:hypothetical protein